MDTVVRKYYPAAPFAVATVQDLDTVLPDAIRHCLAAGSGHNGAAAASSPYSLLVDLFETSTGDARRLAASYGALLSKYPRELFEADDMVEGEALYNALMDGSMHSPAYLDALAEWQEDDTGPGGLFEPVVDIITSRFDTQRTSALVHCIGVLFSSEKTMSVLLKTRSMAERLFSAIAGSKLLAIDGRASVFSETLLHNYSSKIDVLSTGLHSQILQCLRREREPTVHILLDVCNRNKDRLKMQFERDKACSDAEAVVWTAVMLRLAEPFAVLPAREQKIRLVDCQYYQKYRGRLDIDSLNRLSADGRLDESPIRSDHVAAGGVEQHHSHGKPNFVTDCLYMTAHWLKMGYVRAVDDYYELIRVGGEMERVLSSMSGAAAMAPLIRARLQSDQSRVAATKCFLESSLLHLLDPVSVFVHLLMQLLADLFRTNRELYAQQPEFFLEIVNEFWLFVSRIQPHRWLQLREPLDIFLQYALTLLRSPQSCRSIYTRCKIIEILNGWTAVGMDGRSYPLLRLFSHTVAATSAAAGVEAGLVGGMSLSTCLTPLLIKMYIDVESTGASSQFYEKFNIRYHITNILNVLWENEQTLGEYRAAIREEAKRPESFLRFQNHLLNDCTYLLDESLGKLSELHKLQQGRTDQENRSGQDSSTDNSNSNNNNNERHQEERREEDIGQIERQLTSYMQLANATVKLLSLLTADHTGPFARPEIVARLAAMLLVNLKQLVGRRCRELKVRSPEKYHFDPRFLLEQLVRSFVSMSAEAAFCDAVASDSRSFGPELLQEVGDVLRRTGAVPVSVLEHFQEAAGHISGLTSAASGASALATVDVPDEFLDPLMFTVMKDPVRLRTSGVVVDRGTIRAHLLNDPHDPFNRMPLSDGDLEDLQDLRQRIRQFLSEHGA